MNITFLVGNGFDLNLGLNTKYIDFYPYFIENSSDGNIIKGMLIEDDLKWSDLESKLGENTYQINENNVDKFLDDKYEMDNLLLDYLEKEQRKFVIVNPSKLKKEMSRSLTQYTNGLTTVEKESIKKTLSAYKHQEYMYRFISFNYTNTLDSIVSLYSSDEQVISYHPNNNGNRTKEILGEVFHIHGTTNEYPIIAVNDETQIKNEDLRKNSRFTNVFIKPRINNLLGEKKIENAKSIINQSHIICIFGMSLGVTDLMWWEELVTWLKSNSDNKLIIYWKEDKKELKRMHPMVINIKDDIKKMFFNLGKAGRTEADYELIKNRIMIVFNTDIFSFVDANN